MVCRVGTVEENNQDWRKNGSLSRASDIRRQLIAREVLYAQQIKIISLRVVAIIAVTEPDCVGAF
jgi:hypothetical protein